MSNFALGFVYPLTLLILIAAMGLSFFPYFRSPKKYRRNRNRITSLVLHVIVMFLAVIALSGMTFEYDVVNDKNELILLVDASFSNEENKDAADEFVETVLKESNDANKVGVVLFGYDQVYAVKLTNQTENSFNQYKKSVLPDTTATDISAALNYARGLFSPDSTAKIVIISDGLQTDGNAENTIKSVAADGIIVDSVYFGSSFDGDEIQITDVEMPNDISLNTEFKMKLTVKSSFAGTADLIMTDNGENVALGANNELGMSVDFYEGETSVVIAHTFKERGLHSLRFSISCDDDTLEQNNIYCSYHYIEKFENILMITRDMSESAKLKTLLDEEGYVVTPVDVNDVSDMPSSLSELRVYDEVIMVNISNADMPEGFVEILNSYVYDLGGGLFTVGGDKIDENTGEKVANAYNRKDLVNTLYQEMLPVQAIDYTPPLGLMIIIDHSGSMSSTDTYNGKSRLDAAKDGAITALYGLHDRDWCGIMSLDDTYAVEQSLVPATQQNKLINTINGIELNGGTTYKNAIEYAGRALAACTSVEKRHIMLISDGEPSDSISDFGPVIENYNKQHGITFSNIVVKSGALGGKERDLREAVNLGGGKLYHVQSSSDLASVSDAVRVDLATPSISEYVAEPFTPVIREHTSVVSNLLENEWPQLGGFYGTKLKSGASSPLYSEYVPVYAQWEYGKGKVGSFMSDLKGTQDSWSYDFMQDVSTGQQFIKNVINALFPEQNIRYSDLDVGLAYDNYTTDISVYTSMADDETIRVVTTGPFVGDDTDLPSETVIRGVNDGYSRIAVTTKEFGVYEILVSKLDSEGNVISEYRAFRPFSYSAEYNAFVDYEAARNLMVSLADIGRGEFVDNPMEVFDSFVMTLHKSVNPRNVLLILIIALLLLDIAVRKFKWKWPHEIIRERREKSNEHE